MIPPMLRWYSIVMETERNLAEPTRVEYSRYKWKKGVKGVYAASQLESHSTTPQTNLCARSLIDAHVFIHEQFHFGGWRVWMFCFRCLMRSFLLQPEQSRT
ncbi:hypothetical protein AMECASPLE_028279 [Ameca splendens]|uniref:Uncharacterized protein n=1 Tax=Ameca splendens TaxID=208324 RepID=A0ABV0XUA7_9TELE